MTKRFCDICEQELTLLDQMPLIREIEVLKKLGYTRAMAYVAITNERNKPLTDICQKCKIKIVTEGHTPAQSGQGKTIATLQPEVAADLKPSLEPFAEPPALFPRAQTTIETKT